MDDISEFFKLLTAILTFFSTLMKLHPAERRRQRPRKGRARKRKR